MRLNEVYGQHFLNFEQYFVPKRQFSQPPKSTLNDSFDDNGCKAAIKHN